MNIMHQTLVVNAATCSVCKVTAYTDAPGLESIQSFKSALGWFNGHDRCGDTVNTCQQQTHIAKRDHQPHHISAPLFNECQ
jgi:hypothetical protein